MSKTNTSITLDPEVLKYIRKESKSEGIGVSAYINREFKVKMKGGRK